MSEKKGMEALSQVCDFLPDRVRTKKSKIVDSLRDISTNYARLSTVDTDGDQYQMPFGTEFRETITEEGLCYTYNKLDENDFYKNITDPMLVKRKKFSITQHGIKYEFRRNRSNWTVFGYEEDNEPFAYPNRIRGTGVKAGLSFQLKMRKKDIDFTCKGAANGFRLLLHTPDEMPQPSTNFFRIPFDVETLISVKPMVMSTSENLKPYTPKQRQCFFPGEKKLKFFKAYNQANCKLECFSGKNINKTLSLMN